MKILNKFYVAILIIFSMLVFPKLTYAGFGITPSDIIKDNLKPGSNFETTLTITRSDPKEELKIEIEPELEEMKDWFTFIPGNKFVMPKGIDKSEIKVKIVVPENADLKQHKGFIRVKAIPNIEQTEGVSVVKGARIMVDLITTNINLSNLNIRTINIENSFYEDPLVLKMLVENKGNITSAPDKAVIEIYSLNKELLKTFEIKGFSNVSPNAITELSKDVVINIDPGEYFANVKVYSNNEVVRAEEMYFRYEAKIPVKEITTVDSNQLESRMNLNNNGILFILLAISFTCLLVIYLSIKKSHNNRLFTILIIIIGTIILIPVMLVARNFASFKNSESYNLTKFRDVNIQSNEQKLPDSVYQKQVMGIKSAENNTKNLQSKGIYPVYQDKSANSTIIYEAKNGEKVKLLKSDDNWLYVSINDNVEGWIETRSIQK